MNAKRGLIGLFVMIFFISGIGMAVLVEDDRKDLSSRASVGLVSNLLSALPEEHRLINGNTIEMQLNKNSYLKSNFDTVLWTPPKADAPVFYHNSVPITVRIISEVIDSPKLKEVLGPDFISPKLLETLPSKVVGWSLRSYSYNFFGTPKIVDVWSKPSGLSLIAVMPDTHRRSDVQALAEGLSEYSGARVEGTTTLDDTARLAAQVRPSVVMILNNYCASVKYSDKNYPYCLAQVGSGFFINKDGYIATNGHVVSNTPESSLFYSIVSGTLDNFLTDYFQAYLTIQTGSPVDRSVVDQKIKDAHKSKETIYQMAALTQDMFKKNLLTIENSENHFFVQLGNTPVQLSKSGVNVGKDVVVASLVDSDYAAPDPVKGFSSSDVAIVKILGSNFPALPLGEINDVSVGSDVLVVGFPGVVMGSNSLLLDSSANAEPTFTKGVVSSFKQAKGDKKNLIQTDASINHGNSGGPALSSSGKVIGIATYGLVPDEGSGNYNFLRDIADLKTLMKKNNISDDAGQTYSLWESGLNNYWLSYFKYAKDDFDKVISLNPSHPTVAKYLSEATSKIDSVEDQTPQLSHLQRKLFINLSGGAMSFSIFMIIVLSISQYIDSKRRRFSIVIPPHTIQTF